MHCLPVLLYRHESIICHGFTLTAQTAQTAQTTVKKWEMSLLVRIYEKYVTQVLDVDS